MYIGKRAYIVTIILYIIRGAFLRRPCAGYLGRPSILPPPEFCILLLLLFETRLYMYNEPIEK